MESSALRGNSSVSSVALNVGCGDNISVGAQKPGDHVGLSFHHKKTEMSRRQETVYPLQKKNAWHNSCLLLTRGLVYQDITCSTYRHFSKIIIIIPQT